MFERIGDYFQKETKYSRDRLSASYLDWRDKPSKYKRYSSSINIELPIPGIPDQVSLAETLRKRKSIRNFSTRSISKSQLSYLLWASTGIQRKENGFEFRTAPSAGALYPIETYLASNNVDNMEKAVYHYSIESHSLEELQKGDFGDSICQAALGQRMFVGAAVIFIWTAIFERSKWKYSERAYRYVYLDAGHIVQNLVLSATSIGLGSCQVGAFFDDEMNQIIGIDGIKESVIYLTAVGFQK